MRDLLAAAATAVWLVLLVWLCLPWTPAAPLDDPELLAAQALIEGIASRPHPHGSDANRVVKNLLLEQLTEMGLSPEVQQTTVVDRYPAGVPQAVHVAGVENIVARINGRHPNQAVLLMCHYDARANAPGAGDDGAGVAAVLAAARQLVQGPQPERDIIVLITDGEETGLVGAQAFFEQHPAAAEVAVVLNFEARGSSGVTYMFETSSGNANLVAAFAEAVPQPLASSVSYEVYRRMPNDTDLSIAKAAGTMALNFAFIDSFPDYHSTTDSPANLDPDALFEMIRQGSAAARHFAYVSELPQRGQDGTFFSLPGGVFIQYDKFTVALLSLILLALGLWRYVVAIKGGLRLNQLGRGLAVVVVLATITSSVLFALVTLSTDGPQSYWHYFFRHKLLLLAYLLITSGLAAWLFTTARRGLTLKQVIIATLIPVAALVITGAYVAAAVVVLVLAPLMYTLRTSLAEHAVFYAALLVGLLLYITLWWWLPHVSYLLVWPLLALLLATVLGKHQYWGWLSIGAITTLSLWVPLVYLAYLGLGINAPHILFVVVTLILAWLSPLVERLGRLRWLPPITASTGLMLTIYALSVAPFSARQPQPENLFYAWDIDQQQGYWASDDVLSPWQQALFDDAENDSYGRILPNNHRPVQFAPAQAISWPEARLEDVKIRTQAGQRHYDLRIKVPSGAESIRLLFRPGVRLSRASIEGMTVPLDPSINSPEDWHGWTLRALPEQGWQLSFTVAGEDKIRLRLIEIKGGWPDLATMPQRPVDSMPRPYSWSNHSIAWQDLEL